MLAAHPRRAGIGGRHLDYADEVAALLLDAIAVDARARWPMPSPPSSLNSSRAAPPYRSSIPSSPTCKSSSRAPRPARCSMRSSPTLKESYAKAEGVASYTAQDIIEAVAVEVATESGTATATDRLEAVLTSALTGAAPSPSPMCLRRLSPMPSRCSARRPRRRGAAVIVEAYAKANNSSPTPARTP